MKKLALVLAVFAALAVPAAQANAAKAPKGPTMAQFNALKKTVATLQKNLTEARNIAIAGLQYDVCLTLRRHAHDPTPAAVRSGHIKICVAVESQSLRASQPAIKRAHFAAPRDAIDPIVARGGRSGNIQIARRMKRQVVRRQRRLQRREHKNLATRADFENRPAAISHIQILIAVECNARRDAHPLHPLLGTPVRRDAVNGSVVPA